MLYLTNMVKISIVVAWDNSSIALFIRTHIRVYPVMQVIKMVRKRTNHANIFSNVLIKSKNSLIIITY